MKKKRDRHLPPTGICLKQILVTMKLTGLLIFLFTIQLSAKSVAQHQVSLEMKDVGIVEIIQALRVQTGVRFFYNHNELKRKAPVTISVKDDYLESVLKQILDQRDLSYSIREDVIIIVPKNETTSQKITTWRFSGVVKDDSGESLPGATIRIKGTTLGTTTDVMGKFVMEMSDNKPVTLMISFIGMQTKEVTVTKDKPIIEIMLVAEESELDEVVITGYFNKKQDSFTGSVTQIKREELKKFGNKSLISTLQLLDPGFKLEENNEMGSDPNTLPEFFIRGKGSFAGSNVPTFIVDGYQVPMEKVFDMNIDQIESVNILKDASATIFYGSRAANGVVVIETRKPANGKWEVSYYNRTSLSVADLSDYNLMNASEKIRYEQLSGLNEISHKNPRQEVEFLRDFQNRYAQVLRGVDTEWLSQPIRNAVSHNHSLNFSGSNNEITYQLSGYYSKQDGVIKSSSRENYDLSFYLTYRIRDKVSFRNVLSYSNTVSTQSPYGSFSDYASANPYNPIYDTYGKLIENYTPHAGVVGNGKNATQYQNHLYNATLEFRDRATSGTVTDNISIDYYFTPDLRLMTNAAFSKSTSRSERFLSPLHGKFSQGDLPIEEKGEASIRHSQGFSWDFSATLNYNIQKDKHILFMGTGVNLRDDNLQDDSYRVTGFADERYNDIRFAMQFAKNLKPSSSNTIGRTVGYMGNLNYAYDNRYLIDFSIRVDGSSIYGNESRYAKAWSAGFAWNIHHENFTRKPDWLNELKIRGSIGSTGSQDFDATLAETLFEIDNKQMYDGALSAIYTQYGNPNLGWQQILKRNLGLDLRFWNSRFSLKFDYYFNTSKNLILPVTVAPSLGFSQYYENFGTTENRGYEFNFYALVIRNKNFSWSVNALGNHNQNRIIDISNALSAQNDEKNAQADWKPVSIYEEGESMSAIKAVRSLGINPETGKELFLTKDNDITEKWNHRDKVIVGDQTPKLEGSLGTYIQWKNFSFNASFRYSFGSQIYNETLISKVESADPKMNADSRVFDERWQYSGQHTFYKDIADKTRSNASSRFVQDNNFIQFSSLSLNYRFNSEHTRKIGFQRIEIGLNTSDLFYMSSIKRERGLSYPFAREYTFTLNLNF